MLRGLLVTDGGRIAMSVNEWRSDRGAVVLVAGPARSCFRAAPGVMRAWMASAVALAVVLPVLTVAGLPPVLTVPVLQFGDLVTASLLVAGSVVTVEMGRFFEGRMRVGQRPHKGLSAWAMATVILLPPFWLLPVMVGVYGHARWRGMRVPLWKWVGSAAFLVLAGLLAGLVLRIGRFDHPVGLYSGGTGLLLVAAAVLVFLAVESALLFGSARLCDESDERWLRRTLADPGFYVTEAAVLALGAVTGLLGAAAPWFVVLLVYVCRVIASLRHPATAAAVVRCRKRTPRCALVREPWSAGPALGPNPSPLQRHCHRRAPPNPHIEPRPKPIMSTTNKQSAENATDLLESANTVAAQAADAVKTATAQAEGTIEASVEQIRELNEQAIKSARAAGQRALDAYQAALESVVDAEKKLAEGSQLDWVTPLVTTQAEFTQRLGAIFLTAAREQLK